MFSIAKRVTFTLLLLCVIESVFAQDQSQERRAIWEASSKQHFPTGRELVSIASTSALLKAGLKVGDIVLAIDGQNVSDANTWADMNASLRGNRPYKISYKRKTQVKHLTVEFEPIALENHDNINTEYGFITSDFNIKQRFILTRPKQSKSNPVAAVFVVGGLSCSSIESTPGRQSNFVKTLVEIVKQTKMMVMRIEKPGVGDSQGNCSKTDFLTELNGYEVALQSLLARDDIDKERVVVFGSSMGGVIAPYLANKYKLNGVISDGPYYRTWFEHMLEIERRILRMQGNSESDISEKMNTAFIPLYYGMLIQKRSFADLIDQNPLLESFNYHGNSHKYGRPVEFYHQLQDFDVAGEWATLKVPTRVRWGTKDWIMSESDIDMIEDALKANGNDNFLIHKYPGMDHWYAIHESETDSFQGKAGQWESKIADQIVNWIIELNQP